MKIKIDKDFKNLIPPLSPAEFNQLEENLLSEKRCREAILIWKGFVIDGHNRLAICQKHKIPYKFAKLHFASKVDAMIWITEHQLGRRNLSDAVRIELAAARVKMLNAGGVVRKAIAEAAGVGEQTVHRYMKVVSSGDSHLIEQLRKNEIKINNAYKQIKGITRTVKRLDIGPSVGDEPGVKCYDYVCGQLDRVERFF